MTGLIAKFKLKSNPVSIRRTVIVEALVVTVAAHALLFSLFYYRPAVAARPESKVARITLFNADSVSPEHRARIEGWLAGHDPAAIGRSDRAGSPLTRLKTASRPEPPVRDFPEVEVAPGEYRAVAPQTLPVSAAPSSPVFERAPAEPVFPRIAPVGYPEVLLDGRKSAVALSEELCNMGKSLNAHDTEIELRFDPALETGRFRVVRSSGSVRLDLLAARELMRQYPERNAVVLIRWSEERGQ